MAKRGYGFYLKKAEEAFARYDYEAALLFYSLAGQERNASEAVSVGAVLASMAMETPEEAHAVFEFYNVARALDPKNAQALTQALIDSIENHHVYESAADLARMLHERAEAENGISYEDFKKLVEENADFRTTFEKVIYSTRVVISDKKDFFEFVEGLIDNGYTEMALAYIDSANAVFPSDEKIRALLNKISERESLEISGS
ncbi:MAG: hypothetical protein AB7E49_08100 [Campylobacterales bacterium]